MIGLTLIIKIPLLVALGLFYVGIAALPVMAWRRHREARKTLPPGGNALKVHPSG